MDLRDVTGNKVHKHCLKKISEFESSKCSAYKLVVLLRHAAKQLFLLYGSLCTESRLIENRCFDSASKVESIKSTEC